MSEYIVKCNEVIGISGKPLIVPDYIDTSKEVVRCRDCEHYTDDEMEYYHYCGNWCEQVEPDGYCAWACRKSSIMRVDLAEW